MATATLTRTRPSTAPAAAPATRPQRPAARPGGVRVGVDPQSRFRLAPPPEVTVWREMLPTLPIAPSQAAVTAVAEQVRAGLDRDRVAAAVGLPADVVLEVVVDLGSRCAQMNKRGPKIKSIRRGAAGELASFTRTDDIIAVRAATGWCGEQGAPDVRRAYSALLCADQTTVLNSLTRWAENHVEEQPVTYTHIADLYSSARGLLPALHLVVDAPSSVRAYLTAWGMLDSAAHEAMRAVAHLTSGRATAASTRTAVRAAFWLLPQAAHLDRLAQRVLESGTGADRHAAEENLWRALTQLRALVETRPARFVPKSLSDLSTVQVRAIAAQHGLFVDDGSHSRSARSLDGFAADVEEARARMQKELTGI